MNFPAGTSVVQKHAALPGPRSSATAIPTTEMSVEGTLKTGSNALLGYKETESTPMTCSPAAAATR